ncbi:MAG: M48 family metallopeptidase [Lysobacteraceae bacterium]
MTVQRSRVLLMLLPVFAWSAEGAALTRDLPPGLQVPEAAVAGPDFDVERATEAYLGLLSPGQRAQSDAYFEGGYWLQLWQLLYGLGVSVLLLATGWSRRMRDRAQRISARRWLSTALYAAMFLLATQLIGLPLSIYTEYVREHAYGLSTQGFGAWFGDLAKGSAVVLVIMPFVIAGLYALLRRAGERWWLYAGMASFALILFISMIAPVFVAPLFNDYKPLPAGEVRESILSLARANRIPTEHIEWFDASRQTTRVSANVSGFAGTTRVNLNDNLLKKTSLPEINAVMGHEMGHYVLNHSLRLSVYFSLLIAFGFWFVHVTFDRAQRRWGQRFGVEGRADPAGLPLISALISVFFFVATPVSNSIVRQAEAEADAYGLNAAGEPHGFATAAMRLSTYRKIHPGKWEEAIFYDHPSGYDRVRRSMEWLKEHPEAGRRGP